MGKEEESVFDTDAIQKLLMKSKTQESEISFAFGLAAKPENCGLILHLLKPGSALKKQVKADPNIRQACFGTLTVVGPDVLLKPTKPLKGIVKQLKKKFREEGLVKFHPVLVDAEGMPLDEESLPEPDGRDEDDDGAPVETSAPEPAKAATDGPDPAALKQRLVAVGTQIKSLSPASPELAAAMLAAVRLLQSEDLAGCAAALTDLETRLAAAPPAAPPAPGKSADDETANKLKQALMERIALIRALPDGPARAALGVQAQSVMETLKAGDTAASVQALKALSAAISGAGTASAPPAPASGDVMEIWRDAKESMDDGISKLQSALRGYNHPALNRIAEFGLNGATNGNQTALMKCLMEFRAANGPDRDKAAKALLAQAGVYAQFLTTDPVLDLCEKNPFGVALPLRATLGGALQKIAKVCQSVAA